MGKIRCVKCNERFYSYEFVRHFDACKGKVDAPEEPDDGIWQRPNPPTENIF